MADIPVERKGGGLPWWAWLLALLAVAGLIWLVAEMADDEPDADDYATPDDVGMTDEELGGEVDDLDAGIATGTLTSLDEIREARRQDLLYGKEVDLDDVAVENVVGDSTFFIQDPDASGDARLLVVLQNLGESETDPAGPTGSDGRYNVDDGDIVDIEGRVDRFRGDEPQVTGQNRDRLAPDSLYINARRVSSDENQVRTQ